ncbi:uncharacterized protein A4U43_C07F8420 [Asparagus officinalis]|uniref:Nuclear pore complex protein NUP214 n=1 Tax=Asparagus officinalis TaxID=4686 RepID=A0A5P1EAB0_ASPOF|nr:uncharacterized protein A4U43_C07F8420 [Asparagus officinalis]
MSSDKINLLLPADDEIEGDRDATADFAFVRIGFFVARTDDVVGAAKEIKEKGKGPSVEDVALLDVKAGGISILAVSGDESTLAAAVGGKILFFSVPSLLNKEQQPLFSCSLDELDTIKDFKWQKNMEKSFVVLSTHGTLYHGDFKAELKNVMENVDAVDWSAKGGFVAVARRHIMTILSFDFKEILSLSLFFKTWPLNDSDYTIKVDSIKWLRDDSIIIGCFQVNEDGEEEGYLVQVVKSKDRTFSEASCNPIVYSFPDLFDGVWDILPFGRGPYLLANYLDYWDVVLASNQKAIDQHILLLKWSKEDNRREVVSLEFSSDKHTPKIEVPENGDDNLVLGFCIEQFSSNEKINIKVDDKFKELSPRCILLCLTSEGKLNLFYAARVSEPVDRPQTSLPLDNNDVVSSSENLMTKPQLKDDIENATSENQSTQICAEALNSHKDAFQLQREIIPPQRKQVGDSSPAGLFTGEVANSKSSLETHGSGFILRNNMTPSINVLSNTSTKVVGGTTSSGKIASEPPASMYSNKKDVASQHGEVSKRLFALTGVSEAPFGSQSTENIFGANISPSTFTLTRSVVSDAEQRTKLGSVSSETQSSDQLFSSKDSNRAHQSLAFSSGKVAQNKECSGYLPSGKGVELVPAVQGSRLLAQEGSIPGMSQHSRSQHLLENIRASKFSQTLDSERDISKQFYDVKDMVKELDILLSFIEEKGRFRDACTVFQRSSLLALENNLEDISATAHKCKKDIEGRLTEIQQLQNKMLQVSARQGYMKGIVEQASNRKYWDIWNQQKLNPELEAKRQNILNANQNLTNQIIELERHFHTLEINRFGGSGRTSLGHTTFQSGSLPVRQKQSLQSVYNTLNSQLAAAEHLSECLSQQMSELNLNSVPVKRRSITKELFESIGLSDENMSFESPACKRSSLAPYSTRRTPPSVTGAISDHLSKKILSAAKAFEPETARRRRDSLDKNWTGFEPPKTTVKRSMQVQYSRFGAEKPFRKAKENFDSQMEAFATQQKNNATRSSSSSWYLLNEGIQDSHSKVVVEPQSNSGSKWAQDITERNSTLSQSMSPSITTADSFERSRKDLFGSPPISSLEAMPVGHLSNPFTAKTVASSRNTSLTFSGPISPMNTGQIGDVRNQASTNMNQTSGGNTPVLPNLVSMKHVADSSVGISSITNENIFSPFSTLPCHTSAQLNGKTTEFNKTTIGNQSNESILNSASYPKASTSSSSRPFSSFQTPATASSTPSSTPAFMPPLTFKKTSHATKPAVVANQTASALTSTSTDNQSLLSSSLISSESQNSMVQANALPAKPFGASFSDSKFGGPNQVASISTSTPGPSSHSLPSSSTMFSQTQKSSSTTFASLSTAATSPGISEPTTPVTSATVSSIHLDNITSNSPPSKSPSEEVEPVPKTQNNLLLTNSSSTPLPASLSQPQIQPSTTPLTTTTEKDQQVDVSLSQEDEMEEEAPNTSTLSLGSLGGFGLGSSPSSNAPKPNPFGGSFLSANSTTPSPPPTLAAPAGEPFRPASFSLPSAQPLQISPPASSGGSSSGFGGGFSGFGQPSQVGTGQQALGSVLGSFGQSRQLGSGMPGIGFPSSGGLSGGGFTTPAANTGGFASAGGFSGAATGGGGFKSVASAGGGFAAAAKGGGFASLASGGGFAGATGGGVLGAALPARLWFAVACSQQARFGFSQKHARSGWSWPVFGFWIRSDLSLCFLIVLRIVMEQAKAS